MTEEPHLFPAIGAFLIGLQMPFVTHILLFMLILNRRITVYCLRRCLQQSFSRLLQYTLEDADGLTRVVLLISISGVNKERFGLEGGS